MDLHAGQIQGFFNIPVDHLYAAPVLIKYIQDHFEDVIMVSPDAGGVERTRAFAKRLKCGLAIIDKRRDRPNECEAMHVIGDVSGKVAILMDDMVDTAGTLCNAAAMLKEAGAEFNIKNFGVEAQNVLRMEKCHIILGQESEQRTNLLDDAILHGRLDAHVPDEQREVVQLQLLRLDHGHGVGGCGGLEADPEEHDLSLGLARSEFHRVEG